MICTSLDHMRKSGEKEKIKPPASKQTNKTYTLKD
jgi:hypothetical protein